MNLFNVARDIKITSKIAVLIATIAIGLSAMVWIALAMVQDQMRLDRMLALKWILETAHGIADDLDERVQAGELTQEAALANLGQIAKGMRFSDGEYLFANTYQNINVFHSARADLAGQDHTNLKDKNGFYFVREQSRIAQTKEGEGVLSYIWTKPGSDVTVEKLAYVKAFRPWNIYIGTGIYMDDFEADFGAFRFNMLLSASLVLILSSVLMFWIGRNISRPTNSLTAATRALADGKLDTEIPERDRGDELGKLAAAVQVFKEMALETEKLRVEAQEHLRETEDMMTEQARLQNEAEEAQRQAAQKDEEASRRRREGLMELSETFEGEVGSIVGDLQAVVGEMREASRELSRNSESSNSECAQVAVSAGEASANVQTVASASEELTASIQEISRQLSDSRQSSANAVDMINGADQAVSSLADQADKINQIINLITDIAEQTNLLALNATIEAARAGDAGKGFAVVASEVKALATQTSKAATEIGDQIVNVQEKTDATVESIRGVKTLIHQNDGVTSSIAAAVEEQGAATQEIVRNIQEAANGTGDVSERVETMRSLTSGVESGAQSARVVSRQLGDLCESLNSSAKRFLDNMRAG